MEQLNNNDILLYLDCGCEVDNRERDFLIEYFDIVKKDYIMLVPHYEQEKIWNKMDLILELDMNNDIFLKSIQHQAGVLLFLVCEKTRKLVNEWYQIACNYHMIDDSPSINTNYDVFKEHRHDQSIFSLLTKKYNLYSNTLLNKCVKYIRNRTGISINQSISTLPTKKHNLHNNKLLSKANIPKNQSISTLPTKKHNLFNNILLNKRVGNFRNKTGIPKI